MCCFLLPPIEGHKPEIVQRDGNAPPVTYLPADSQAPREQVACRFVLTLAEGHVAKVVQRKGYTPPVLCLPVPGQCLRASLLHRLVVPLLICEPPRPGQHLAPDRGQGLGVSGWALLGFSSP